MARRVIANIVLTLDGRTSGPAGAGDMSVIAPHGVSEQARDALMRMTEADTALLGRNNYEGFFGWWPSVVRNPEADPRDRAFSRWLNDVDKVVFSRTLVSLEWSNARLATASPADTVRELRELPGGDIRVLSSGGLIRQLLDANLIDRLELTLAPTIVGDGGQKLFDPAPLGSKWRFTAVAQTASGALQIVADRDDEGRCGADP